MLLSLIKKYQSLFFFFLVLLLSAISARAYYGLDPNGIISLGDFFELPSYDDVNRYNYAVFDHIGTLMGNPLALTNWYYIFLDWFYSFESIFIHRHFYYIVLYFTILYISIYSIVRLFSEKIEFSTYILILLAVFNPLTLTFFRYSWGFTHYSLHYIGLAVLIIGYVLLLQNSRKLSTNRLILGALYTGLILLFTTSNIAFLAVAGLIMLIISFGYLLSVRDIKEFFRIHLYYGIIVTIATLMIGYYMYSIQGEFKDTIKYNVAFGGDAMSFIRAYSSSILDTISFNINAYGSMYVGYGIMPFTLLLGILFYLRARESIYLIIPLCILILISVRIHTPFVEINTFIYDSFIGSFIRSADKVFFVYVILFCSILLVLLPKIKTNLRVLSSVSLLLFVVLLCLQYPLKSIDIVNKKYVDILVNIPTEYRKLSSILTKTDRVVAIPYNALVSPAWSDHTVWHQRGNTILSELTQAEWISANVEDHPASGGRFRFKECPKTSEELFQKARELHASHYIVHTDIDSQFMECSNQLITLLGEDSRFTEIEFNYYYTLFSIENESRNRIEKISPSHHKIISDAPTTVFEHPYTHSRYWKVTDIPDAKSELYNNYATKFTIPEPRVSIEVEYTPQNILDKLYILRYVYLLLFLVSLTFYMKYSYKSINR